MRIENLTKNCTHLNPKLDYKSPKYIPLDASLHEKGTVLLPPEKHVLLIFVITLSVERYVFDSLPNFPKT